MIKLVLKFVQEKRIVVVSPHYNGVHSSIVYTHQGNLSLVETVDEIMNQICISFCSDLQGRINGSRKKFRFVKKPPILISERLALVAFPLPSPIRGENMWVFSQDFEIDKIETTKSKIIFGKQFSFDIPLSQTSIDKQKVRSIQILYAVTTGKYFPSYINKPIELRMTNRVAESKPKTDYGDSVKND